MALSRIPQEVVTLVTAMQLNRSGRHLLELWSPFVISMFMDEIPLLLLTLQLTFPLITSLGFDPIWFGVLFHDDGGDGVRSFPCGPDRLRSQRQRRCRADQSL